MLIVPERLIDACRGTPERMAWLDLLPEMVRELRLRWLLTLSAPFDDDDVSCAWVAPAVRKDGTPAVLKFGMPHLEAAHELDGLRFWNGDGAVRVLEANEGMNAMLLERCEPGTSLRELPEAEQDVVIAGLLTRLWRQPPPNTFQPLSVMLQHWADETSASAAHWLDMGLVQEGLRLFEELSRPSPNEVLLATDLHAGNVLRSQREPWLAIDPKPFAGDRAFDATQHLMNCKGRVLAAPEDTIRRFADLLEVDAERVKRWMFARSAAEPRANWDEESMALARAVTL
jgi:streptomycin 6-kinase